MADRAGGFYLTCISNASMNVYEKNTQADFTNALTEPLELKDYEVALVEFSYTETWFNVTEDFDALIIAYKDPVENKQYQDTIKIEGGYYPSNKSFFQTINRKLKNNFTQYKFDENTFDYKPIPQKVTVRIPSGVTMLLTKTMSEICGFRTYLIGGYHNLKNDTNEISRFEADWAADVHRGLYTFYVYCNLISPQIVGDTKVPLLRTIPVKTRTGVEQVTKSFTNPHYLPLNKNYINSIEILIRDDTGQPISFQRGKTLVKLHLRPRAPAYL